jgi:hypothetical protein
MKICIVDGKRWEREKRMSRLRDREMERLRKGDVRKSWRREERFEEEMGEKKLGGEKREKDEA